MSAELLRRYNAGDILNADEYTQLNRYLDLGEWIKEKQEEIKNNPVFPMPDNGRPSVEDTRFTPVVAKQDNEGHWYVIPADKAEDFHALLEAGEKDDYEQFNEKYGHYRTGGDLNNIQLYIKAETQAEHVPLDNSPGVLMGSPASRECPPLNSVEYEPVFHLKSEGVNRLADTDRPIPENYKLSALEMVEAFHQAFNCPVYITPTLPSYKGAYTDTLEGMFKNVSKYMSDLYIKDSRTMLRMKLIFEEYRELCEAMRDGDFVKILDGLCDLLYVTYGTVHEFGLGPVLKEAFREVHRSNMSKLGADGKPVYREDGKVLKGPYFTPPDLAGILLKHGAYTKDTYPEWDKETWREAVNKAIKEGPKKAHEAYDNLGISASLGANLLDIPGMPEPTNGGVIFPDISKEPPTSNESTIEFKGMD